MFRKWAGVIMAAGALAIAGCNTVAGMGEDVKQGGKEIKETAKETQKKL